MTENGLYLHALIKAAGKGTRMQEVTGGNVPKPLVEIEGVPVLVRTLKNVASVANEITIVVRDGDKVTAEVAVKYGNLAYQNVEMFPGTAEAVKAGISKFASENERLVLIANGDDSSLIPQTVYRDLLKYHLSTGADCTTLGVCQNDSGRKVKFYLGEDTIGKKVEYTGVFISKINWLKSNLDDIKVDPETGEKQISRIFEIARYRSLINMCVVTGNVWHGFNTPQDYAETLKLFSEQQNEK